jgi:ubiquinone/menaquinone biosynthesis C-methylase UbiE
MNGYIADLLKLDTKPGTTILDAGCGIGATSLYLAQRCPYCTFHGITLAPNEIDLATRLKTTKHITNATFTQGSFLRTTYPTASFDAAFALESCNHAEDKRQFITEMHRVLKPHGTLLILDLIPKQTLSHDFTGTSALQGKAVSLTSYLTYLKETGFTTTSIQNLITNRHVNLLDIIRYTLLYNLYFGRSVIKRDRTSLLTWMRRGSLIFYYLLQTLYITYARYGYYVIIAEKNRP